MALFFSLLLLFIAQPTQALTIQPSTFFYELAPGEEISGTLMIKNETSQEQIYRPLLQDVTSVDEVGSPIFFDEGVVTATSVHSWLSFDPQPITLLSGESRDVPFTLVVADDAAPGGYYGALLFSSLQNSAGSQIETRVGSLLVVSVGESTSHLVIDSFNPESAFLSHLPLTFVARISNDGDLPAQPSGTITVSNMFGATRTVLVFNESGASVLPQVSRRLESVWQTEEVPSEAAEVVKEWKNFGFGYYTAWLALEDASGEVLTAHTSFWIVPWELILAGFLMLITLLCVCRRRVS